jgi:hypothetical protein
MNNTCILACSGNPLEFMRPGVSRQEARDMYYRLANEVAAGNVRSRLYESELQRLRSSPQRTKEKPKIPVPRHQQIILFYMANLLYILIAILLLGTSLSSAEAADLSDGLYDREGNDGLHSTVEISSQSAGTKKSLYTLNAIVYFKFCKLIMHAAAQTTIPSGYNQTDFLDSEVISCVPSNNTCPFSPSCSALPLKFVQPSATRLCLYSQRSTAGDCFERIRPERIGRSVTIGGFVIKPGNR